MAAVDTLAAEVSASGVPMLAVDDSVQIAEHAATLGLLDPAQVDQVRAETRAGGQRRPWPPEVLRGRGGRAEHLDGPGR